MSSIEKAIEKLNQAKREEVTVRQSDRRQHSPDPDERYNPPRPANKRPEETPGDRYERIALELLHSKGMLTPDQSNTQISEEYRNIKRPLIKNALGNGPVLVERGNLVMVTSAMPGEGKTFTSINLAMSIAMEKDRSVLLVDADVSKAGITRTLGFSAGLGLSDYLTDESLSLQNIIIKTNVPKLALLSAGREADDMTELLASEEMERLVSDLSRKYSDRIVILDSPPLNATTEARVLTGLAGQVVMVVAAEETSQSAVLEALDYLDRDKPIGFVLNKNRRSSSSSYGYGYGGR